MLSPSFDWPWGGAATAVLLLLLLFLTPLLRTPDVASRWHDTAWLAVLAIPLYMLHQVEEYGIDLQAVRYAFRAALCGKLGFPDAATCLIPFSFFTAVNVGTVWIAAVLAAMLGRHRPLLALSAYGIVLVNALTHIGMALYDRAYNPGLLTAVVLFLPAGLWALHAGRQSGVSRVGLASIVVGGIAAHAVLILSLLAYLHGLIDAVLLVDLQILNAAVPLAVVLLIHRIRHPGVPMVRS